MIGWLRGRLEDMAREVRIQSLADRAVLAQQRGRFHEARRLAEQMRAEMHDRSPQQRARLARKQTRTAA